MIKKKYDILIIGGGAAGMTAAETISRHDMKTAIIEREDFLGGILMQCIHNGFGLHRFKQELTGPEYAELYCEKVMNSGIDVYLNTTAIDIKREDDSIKIITCSHQDGVTVFEVNAVILAMGCRERNRGNIGIPGTRPSGIFTAGLAQRLLNIDGYVPGNKIVIVGSGDIGLIMARRLSWVGCKVLGVVEIMPHPSGLTRNIVQCLDDFQIPLHLSHTVSSINGQDRVESVDVAPLKNGVTIHEESFNLKCDTVLLSVGLIPENELSRKVGVSLSHNTSGPLVDASYMTNINGVFACGNVLHVHDLVDFVSEESERCAEHVVQYIKNKEVSDSGKITVKAGANIKYVVPGRCLSTADNKFYMRSMIIKDKAELKVCCEDDVVAVKKLRYVKPAEMINLELKPEEINNLPDGATLEISIS